MNAKLFTLIVIIFSFSVIGYSQNTILLETDPVEISKIEEYLQNIAIQKDNRLHKYF